MCGFWMVVPALHAQVPAGGEGAASGGAPVPEASDRPATGLESGDLSWDLQVEGGLALGLDQRLDHALVGRARLGALWLLEAPLTLHVGVFGEAGGLSGWGAGLALELNRLPVGWWLRGAAALGDARRTVGSVALGFEILGFEWQVQPATGHHALVLLIRSPFGLWWARKRARPSASPAFPVPASRGSHTGIEPGDVLRLAQVQAERGELAAAADLVRQLLLKPPRPLTPEERQAARRQLAELLGQIHEAAGDSRRQGE